MPVVCREQDAAQGATVQHACGRGPDLGSQIAWGRMTAADGLGNDQRGITVCTTTINDGRIDA